jgi:hypothetical protein
VYGGGNNWETARSKDINGGKSGIKKKTIGNNTNGLFLFHSATQRCE